MPDHDSTDGRAPKEVLAAGEATAGPWSTGDVIRLGSIDSTNRYALEAASSGRGGGFVVVCDHQGAGRGRRGRAWLSPPLGSLLCSILFRPRLEIDQCALLGFAVACAGLEAIELTCGARGSLKWPNDVLVGDRKVAGILAEVGRPGPDGSATVVVGIGINIAFPRGWLAEVLGDDLRPIDERATTLEAATGVRPGRDELLAALLVGLDRRVGHEPTPGFIPAALSEVRERSATIGRTVKIEDGSGTWTGVATGITDTGRLEVIVDGETSLLDAADVVHLR